MEQKSVTEIVEIWMSLVDGSIEDLEDPDEEISIRMPRDASLYLAGMMGILREILRNEGEGEAVEEIIIEASSLLDLIQDMSQMFFGTEMADIPPDLMLEILPEGENDEV